MNTKLPPNLLILGLLGAEVDKGTIKFFPEDSELEVVAIDLGDNTLILNHEEPYFENHNKVEVPAKLKPFFEFNYVDGKMNLKIKDEQGMNLDILMQYFEHLHQVETMKNRPSDFFKED